MFLETLFTIAIKWKQPRCPPTDEHKQGGASKIPVATADRLRLPGPLATDTPGKNTAVEAIPFQGKAISDPEIKPGSPHIAGRV